MINEEKVRLMTRCAIYEEGRGKEEIPLAGYFKSDYIRFYVLKTWLAVTAAFIIILGVYVACNVDKIFEMLNRFDYKTFLFASVGAFLILLIFYYIIARIVYAFRFEKARKGVTVYYRDLKRLKAIYDKESDNRPTVFEEEGGASQNDEFIDY